MAAEGAGDEVGFLEVLAVIPVFLVAAHRLFCRIGTLWMGGEMVNMGVVKRYFYSLGCQFRRVLRPL